jgi:hypothetical protein
MIIDFEVNFPYIELLDGHDSCIKSNYKTLP